jgi:hypothetical protein
MSTYKRMYVNMHSKSNMHVKENLHVNIQPLNLMKVRAVAYKSEYFAWEVEEAGSEVEEDLVVVQNEMDHAETRKAQVNH